MAIRVGVLGCGKIAQTRHIPEYAADPRAQLRAFYNPTRSRAEAMASQYGGRVYDRWEDLLADPGIDAVSICTANQAHAPMAIAALRSGKHVLCEKPMAVTWEECLAMAEAARETGKKLVIAHNQRLLAGHQKARELVAQGAIGRVLSFRLSLGHKGPEVWSIHPGPGTWFFDKDRAAMGAMADLGVHKTDLIQYLLGEWIRRTHAVLSTLDKKDPEGQAIGVDDNAICIYEMESGAVGTMTVSWTYYAGEDNTTVIYGTEGELRIYETRDLSLSLRRRDGTREDFRLDRIQTNDDQTASGMIALFLDALTEERETGLEAEALLHAMKVIFASIRSAREGRAVDVL